MTTVVRKQRQIVIQRSGEVPTVVRPGVAGGTTGAKGDPGGNVMAIGLLTDAHGLTIPSGTDLVRTSGYSTPGIGFADYVADATVDSAWVAAHPGGGFVSANSRGFRLAGIGGAVTPFMFGAVDCSGTPKGSDETPTDCLAALNAMWALVHYLANSKNIMLTMDLSSALGLGLSGTWVLDAANASATWNRNTFSIIGGRLVAMAAMTDLISFRYGNWLQEGLWQLWGGTDTQLNSGNYGDRLIENGMKVFGLGGSRMADIFCQGAKRWALAFDHDLSSDNNNIPTQWGSVVAIQCGSRNNDTTKPAGTYTSGSWLNHPTDNGSLAQRHLMTLPLPTGIDPNGIKVGDLVAQGDFTTSDVAGKAVATIMSIESVAAHSVTVKAWPYLPVETGGEFLVIMGGGVDLFGGNLASNGFKLIQTLSCGIAVRYGSLFSPKIEKLLGESTLLAVQLGFGQGDSMQGIAVPHWHFESVIWSFIDFATCFGAEFQVASAFPGFDTCVRLVPQTITGSTFVDQGPIELLGVTIHSDGEAIHMRGMSAKSRDLGGGTNHGSVIVGNAPENRKLDVFYTPSGFELSLDCNRGLANKSVKDRSFKCTIYGDGSAGAPTDTMTISRVSYQSGITVNGTTSPLIIPVGFGALRIVCNYEPPSDNSDNGNWKVIWSRLASDVAATTSTFTGLEALPIDPLTVLTDFYCEMGRSAAYQDTGTVTPAAARDDPIGRISDLNGTNHLTQGTVGNKLALKKVGPLTFAQSGADDWLQTPSFTRAQPFTLAFAIIADTSLVTNAAILAASGSAMALQIRSNQWRLIAGTGLLVDGRDKRGHTGLAVFNGVDSKLIIDGQLIATGDAGTVGITGGLHLFVAASESSDFLTGAFFAAGCGPGDLSSSAAGLHAYLAALMGSE